ncbi:hypothetical protein LOTGIDRAFT_215104 [Lottia gigantea]|uniref:Uncharacterized protein n=1 Tax=Lottia gigantea TaxID=225164 RepID=V4AL55_LOTGI|nr:hypothetical protein LOTGIDRAFT_215104 [Lottia gigantea]ESO95485.1 hypothetical protein LOTGIDRAFT_215104 [Lottia gigantea]
MLPKDSVHKHIVKRLTNYVPSFTDLFDEESFYIFAFCFVIGTIACVIIASRYVKLDDVSHVKTD